MYDSSKLAGPFESIGRFKAFSWYQIFDWARVVEPVHPFVSSAWVDEPGIGLWSYPYDDPENLSLRARRSLFPHDDRT